MITVYDNFLDEEDFILLQKMSEECLSSGVDIFSNLSWQEEIRKDSNLVLSHRNIDTHNFIKEKINKKIQRNIDVCMFYYWFPMSHIPWHNDIIYSGGLTINLNNSWDMNQGGIYMFSEEKEYYDIENSHITGIPPKRNRAIEQMDRVLHSVCPLSKNAEIRKTIQVFYK